MQKRNRANLSTVQKSTLKNDLSTPHPDLRSLIVSPYDEALPQAGHSLAKDLKIREQPKDTDNISVRPTRQNVTYRAYKQH